MSIFCTLGKHDISPAGIWNGGCRFSNCMRCRKDMVLSGGVWRPVPAGYRVVWKPRSLVKAGQERAAGPDYGKTVDLKGVTVLGERRQGGQRFALVLLSAHDENDYSGSLHRVKVRPGLARPKRRSWAQSMLSTLVRRPKRDPRKKLDPSLTDMLLGPSRMLS